MSDCSVSTSWRQLERRMRNIWCSIHEPSTVSGTGGSSAPFHLPFRGGQGRHIVFVFAAEDRIKQIHYFPVNAAIIGKNIRPVQIHSLASHPRDCAARFLHQQSTGSHVPRIQPEFPKRFEAAASSISEVDRGRAAAPNSMRQHCKLVIKMDVHILMPLAAGKTGSHKCIIKRLCRACMNG